MPAPLSLQLYTVRDACRTDLTGVLRRVADMGFGAADFTSEAGVRKAAEKMAEGSRNAAKRGMRIAVHNHEFEFTNRHQDRSAYALMLELAGPSVFAELDIY